MDSSGPINHVDCAGVRTHHLLDDPVPAVIPGWDVLQPKPRHASESGTNGNDATHSESNDTDTSDSGSDNSGTSDWICDCGGCDHDSSSQQDETAKWAASLSKGSSDDDTFWNNSALRYDPFPVTISHYTVFYAGDESETLPSIERVHQAGRVLSRLTEDDTTIVSVDDECVVKYGRLISRTEPLHMFLAEKHLSRAGSVISPKLYGVVKDNDNGVLYIFMEFIHGTRLDLLLPLSDTKQSRDISSRISSVMTRLRDMDIPECYEITPADLFRQMYMDDNEGEDDATFALRLALLSPPTYTETTDGTRPPPYTEEDTVYATMTEDTPLPSYTTVDSLEDHIWTVLRNQPLVFTHGSFKPTNIIIKADGTPILTAWSRSGWAPRYWEYLTATMFGGVSERSREDLVRGRRLPTLLHEMIRPYLVECSILWESYNQGFCRYGYYDESYFHRL